MSCGNPWAKATFYAAMTTLLGVLATTGCGNGDTSPDDAVNGAGAENEDDDTGPGGTGTSATASTATPPGDTTEPASTSTTTAPTTTTSVPGMPTSPGTIAPGTPEVLLDGLDFPGRIALDGDAILIGNRAHYRDSTLLDQLLRFPKSGGAPTTLAEAPSIEGFLVVGNQIWINSSVGAAVIGFDRATGSQAFSVPFSSPPFLVQMTQNDDYVFVALAAPAQLVRLTKDAAAQETIWASSMESTIQWLKATSDAVFLISNDPIQNQANLVRVPQDGASAEILVQRASTFGGIEVLGVDVYFADYSAGSVERLPQAGGMPELVGSVEMPWALTAETGTIYVSAQPEACTESATGAIHKLPFGGIPETLALGLPCPSTLIADSDALYWINNGNVAYEDDGLAISSNGSLMRLLRE